MASVQSNVDWQSTKNTILERNRHMFNNSDMSDISFTCKRSGKTFYAHKYVLGTSSAVFHAMFYGALAVKDSTVHLSDTNEESLEQFLRFLYTEECALTGDNVVATMDLAKEYLIPSLVEKCVNFMLENLNPENVLVVLEQAIRFEEKELEERCWEFIECATSKVVDSDSFNNINQTTLAKLLKRDNLKILEVELFKAVLKWIDLQCRHKKLETTEQNQRSFIGEAIYDFRFIGMSQAEFEHVSKSGLLTVEEMIPIYDKFRGIDSDALKWTLPKRKPASTVRFPRCTYSGIISRWTYDGHTPDCLRFSVNKAVLLLGVRLFGDKNESEYQVTFEVKEVKEDKVTAKVTRKYTSQSNPDGIPGFEVMLDKPIILNQNKVVALSATITGPDSYRCTGGLSSTTLEEVTVTFSDSPRPNNGTIVTDGQFHEIILEI